MLHGIFTGNTVPVGKRISPRHVSILNGATDAHAYHQLFSESDTFKIIKNDETVLVGKDMFS